jgi:hypothetical protein
VAGGCLYVIAYVDGDRCARSGDSDFCIWPELVWASVSSGFSGDIIGHGQPRHVRRRCGASLRNGNR